MTLLAGLMLGGGLSGCSGGDPRAPVPALAASVDAVPADEQSPLNGLSALQVWEKTKADADAARSVHVIAHLLDGERPILIDLRMSDTGKVLGNMTIRRKKVLVRRMGRVLYLKAGPGFWATTDAATVDSELAGKWVRVRPGFDSDLDQYFQLTDMDFMVADLMSLSEAERQTLKLVPGIDVDRRKTVGLAGETLSSDARFETLYVAATGPALPLNFAIGTDRKQFMKFRGWDRKVSVVRPKGAIDLAKAG